MPLDPEFKKDWVEALRSGEYQQGRQALCSGSEDGLLGVSWCCIGVGADVGLDLEWEETRIGVWALVLHDGGRSTTSLIQHELDALGLTASDQRALISMNDASRRTFGQIADWIEANL